MRFPRGGNSGSGKRFQAVVLLDKKDDTPCRVDPDPGAVRTDVCDVSGGRNVPLWHGLNLWCGTHGLVHWLQ